MTTNSFGTRDRLTVGDTSYVVHRLIRNARAHGSPVRWTTTHHTQDYLCFAQRAKVVGVEFPILTGMCRTQALRAHAVCSS